MPVPIPVPPGHSVKRAAKTILLTGLIVAIIDGLAAIVLTLAASGRSPAVVFQYIASGLIGQAAFSGGTTTVIVGVLCHFFIAMTWSATFFLLHPFVSSFVPGKMAKSILYGIIIWTMMNLVILPASLVQRGPFNLKKALTGSITLVLAAGVPIAIRLDQYYSRKPG